LELLGGYDSTCTTRILNPDNTVFDAAGADLFEFQPVKNLTIEGIRFQNITGIARRVEVDYASDGITVEVRNNAFAGVAFGSVDSFGAGTMRFLNNRVTNYPGPTQGNFPALRFAGIDRVRFTGNTLADNLAPNGGAKFCVGGDLWLLNNIAWNNAGDDFQVFEDCSEEATGNARFRNNLYQTAIVNPTGDSGNNLVGTDPLFVNASIGNYRLQNASAAINSGVVSSSTTSLDLAGNVRVVGSTVDRGAYESALDDTLAAVLTVTNTNDSGAGSLRQAIIDANTNADFNFINFAIPGGCPQVIFPASDLPAISQGVSIDGYTQAGSAANTLSVGENAVHCVVLEGGNLRGFGLRYAGASSTQFWVQGLAFAGFRTTAGDGAALRIAGGTGNLIRGNRFGGRLSSSGVQLNGSNHNIVLTGLSRSTIGGDLAGNRNVIAGATGNGIWVTSTSIGMLSNASNDNEIVNNLIGSYGREVAGANNNGIKIDTRGNEIRDNAILFNSLDGIYMDVATAQNNLIQFNHIGMRRTICIFPCTQNFDGGNGRHGIHLFFGPHDNVIQKNTIRYNGSVGIAIGSSAGGTSLRNWLVGNSLYLNGAQGTFFNTYNGADNDTDPAQQNMANRGMNYPVLTRATGGALSGSLQGSLQSINGQYVIEIFSSAQADNGFARGEAEKFHRAFYYVTIINATPSQNGTVNFNIPFSSTSGVLNGRVITATATDTAGNSSELSAPVPYELSEVIFANGFEN
jgi:hypothetical protein